MPIQFPQLLQESWNFIRNQWQFSLFAIGLLGVIQFIFLFFLPDMSIASSELVSYEEIKQQLITQLPLLLFFSLLGIWAEILILLNIKAINQGSYTHFFQPITATFKYFLPVVGLMILMIIPMSIALSFGGTAMRMGGFGILAIPFMLIGLYLFFRLCLVVYVYLLEQPQKTASESVKFIWQVTRGKTRLLILYCLISYLLPNVIVGSLESMSGGNIGLIISQSINVVFTLFVMVFGFRFYQVVRSLPVEE